MKKVLILAYDFPPYLSVGALRPYYWYKYFREFGLYPVVVSRQWNEGLKGSQQYVSKGFSDEVVVNETEFGTLIRAPYEPNIANRLLLKYGENRFKFIRKFFTAFFEISQWYLQIGPKTGIYDAAMEYLKTNKVDCVIATADPFILFKYASMISDKTGIPWIADYRDLWIENNHENNWINSLMNVFFKKHERRVLRNVSSITGVADFIVKSIHELAPNTLFHVVPNGFDSETVLKCRNTQQDSEVFTLTYIGRIYKNYPINTVFGVLDWFLNEHKIENFRLRLIGLSGNINLKEWEKNFPVLLSKTEIEPSLEPEILMKELAKSNAFLLFNMNETIGTKIYDYIAINRKIIFCFESNCFDGGNKQNVFCSDKKAHTIENCVQEKFILSKNAGIIVRDENHLKHVLNDLYQEFNIRGIVPNEALSIDEYSRKNQTGKLAEIIYGVIKDADKK
jgi:glycosyltransferase involved in cell wall biosynthesis